MVNPAGAAPGGETMTPELMPCPFCGGEARMTIYDGESLWSHETAKWSSVSCSECDAMLTDQCDDPDGSQSVEAWNRRVVPASTPTRAATDAEIGEHHWRDGLRFKRLENGTVRIRRDANVIATIPAAEWESIVREVEPANRANGTALDGRLIASEVAGSALNEKERIALDWVIRDNDLAARGEEVCECNADEASAMYAVANTLRGLRDRLTGSPGVFASPSSTTATPDALHPADEAMLQSYATRQIGEGMPGMVQDASKLARYAIILRMQLSAASALPSSRALSDVEQGFIAEVRRFSGDEWKTPQYQVRHLLSLIDRLTGAPK